MGYVLKDIMALRAYLHQEKQVYFGKCSGLSHPCIAMWHPPSRSSRTEWDFAVASSGYGKLFREEAVELK